MITFIPLLTDKVRAFQPEGPDANGMPPERRVSHGVANRAFTA